MQSAPLPPHEAARLEALRRYRILDTDPERFFDDVTRLASYICDAPVALMSLVDERRQWFKSKVGIRAGETPRDVAFCSWTVLGSDLMVVEDALADSRFADNPLVTGDPGIRFYAGAPLQTPDGLALGALCVIDRKPRKLTEKQEEAIAALARIVVTELERQRGTFELAAAIANVKTLSGLLPICSFCKGIRADTGYWQRVEEYMQTHTEVRFSHSVCPDCARKHYPDLCPEVDSLAPGTNTDG